MHQIKLMKLSRIKFSSKKIIKNKNKLLYILKIFFIIIDIYYLFIIKFYN